MEQRSPEQGFTLVELMVTVAIIAILAMIVVPQFTKESHKAKAMTEVGAMFGELGVREDQYKTENAGYLEADACPASPSSVAQDATSCIAPSTPWDLLRIRLPTTKLHCSYKVTTKDSSSTAAPAWLQSTDWAEPPISWYFIVATCDMDGDGVQSEYFVSSVDSKIKRHNDGE